MAVVAGVAVPDPIALTIRAAFRYATLSVLLSVVAAAAVLAIAAPLLRHRLPQLPTAQRARASCRSFVDATPWFAAVTAVGAVAWAAWYSLSRANSVPRIFSDELIHATAARGLAERGSLESGGYGPLTPAIDSIAYILTEDDVSAYHLIQAINVTLMILAVFPAYLLARRALSHRHALVVAGLAVGIPWLVYARFVMTEAAFYPIFLAFVLVLVRALELPTIQRQAALVLAVAVAFSARTQAVVLPAAVIAATALHGISRGSTRATLRAFAPTWALYAIAGAAVAGFTAVGTWNPLGAYDVLLHDSWRHPRGLVLWAASNLTSLSLGLGVLALPAAALGVAELLKRRSGDSEKAFASAAIAASAVVLLTVVVLAASPHGQGIVHERNLFYVAPLIFICALAWTTRGCARPRLATSITLGIVVALALAMPPGVVTAQSVDALSFKLWTQLDSDWFQAWEQMLLAVVAGACVVALMRSGRLLILTAVLTAIGVAAASDYRSDGSRSVVSNYAWIDRTLAGYADQRAGDPTAMILWVGCGQDDCSLNQRYSDLERMALYTEFFNSRISRTGQLRGNNGARGLAAASLDLRTDGVVTDAGKPLRPAFVVADARIEIGGTRIAVLRGRDAGQSTPDAALSLWRVRGALRIVGLSRSRLLRT